ncbi:transcription repressor OFP4-like [Salvia miltiorrhiza]|uniref:transcription repressor OFP4-like n=1 Tax=Salvia miltiorrhiza TaxID=226208 RepID=UPI0025AC2C99|nr:transcription repressor OFP4-like [Salvia miltiorrhiza]
MIKKLFKSHPKSHHIKKSLQPSLPHTTKHPPNHRRRAAAHMSSDKIHKLKSIFTASGGCGCRPKPADIVEPQTKPKPSFSDQKSTLLPSSSATSAAEDDAWSSTTFSLTADASPHHHTVFSKTGGSCPKIHNSFAVVKDSDDPYHDFRQSMLQMICEKKMYSRNDLQQLLDCFLKLNSPRHHEVIVRAFVEIWSGGKEAPPRSM